MAWEEVFALNAQWGYDRRAHRRGPIRERQIRQQTLLGGLQQLRRFRAMRKSFREESLCCSAIELGSRSVLARRCDHGRIASPSSASDARRCRRFKMQTGRISCDRGAGFARCKQAPGRYPHGSSRPFFGENALPSVLAKARTKRVERRTSESGDLHNPAPADCPDIRLSY